MQGEERADQQAAEPVDILDREPRPPGQALPAGQPDPDADDGRQQDVGHDPGGPGRVPVDRARGQVHAGQPSVISAHRRVITTTPSRSMNLPRHPAGRPASPARRGRAGTRRWPRCRRARHVGPQAVTCSQGDARGRPVRGSIRWCCDDSAAAPAAARRAAASPERRAPAAPRRHRAARCRWASAIARSPPAETQPPGGSSSAASSTAIALTTPFRSSSTPGGRGDQAAVGANLAGTARMRGSGRQPARCQRVEIAVVAGRDECPAQGRDREPHRSAGWRRAPHTAPRQTQG